MANIFISLGTNIDREHNLNSGVREIKNHFNNIILSPVYKTNAVGFTGEFFYNMVIKANTSLSVCDVVLQLQSIEDQHGRTRSQSQLLSRTLDLDLLLYDDKITDNDKIQLPRKDILNYAFVLKPLADIAPTLQHPKNHKTYISLWNNFADKEQHIAAIDFQWNAK